MARPSRDRFKAVVESMLGIPFEGDLDEVAMAVGVDLADARSVEEFERRWRTFEPQVEAVRMQTGRGSLSVEDIFQRLVEERPNIADPAILATRPAAIRMLVATRIIEGQVDNGGWPAVFYNACDGLLPAAIEGYRLLGLDHNAALADRVRAHGWIDPTDDTPDDPAWDAFDAEWFALADAEQARARYLREHPREFGLDEAGASVVGE